MTSKANYFAYPYAGMSLKYRYDPIRIVHIIMWPIFYLVFKFFLRFKAIDTENYKNIQGPAIFVSNHGTYLDPFLIGAGIPWFSHFHAIHFLAHDTLFEDKFLNIILKAYGSFPGRAYKGDESVFKTPSELLSKGISIGIFKEWCYDTNPAKGYIPKMISTLSIQNNVPIIPIFTYGIYNEGISWRTFLKRKRIVRVAYGKPIYPDKDTNEQKLTVSIEKNFNQTKTAFINSLHQNEKVFWNGYAHFYHHLEKTDPYNDLLREINTMLPDHLSGRWLDVGSGSGGIVNLLVKKADKNSTEVHSSDLDPHMLKQISERFADEKIVHVRHLDLSSPLDLKNSYFDGITANLVLPYVVHHRGEIGKKSLIHLLESLHKALRPGGVLLWSTPRHNVSFFRVFVRSWRSIIDSRHLENLYYGPTIFWHAIKIQRKGVSGIYSFLKPEEIKIILEKVGFTEIMFKRSMAGQVDVVVCKKK